MIDGLEPYPAYKDSGVPSLGVVPQHWEVGPIARIGQLFKGNGGSKEDEVAEGVPCVRYGDLYTRHEFFVRSAKACVSYERASAYTPIRPGDVLFAASGETIEDIGRSAVNLVDGPACCGGDVLLLRPSSPTDSRFLGYAADAHPARHQKAAMGRGFTVVHVYASQLKRLTLALPPLQEQAAIVRFLGHSDRRIRRYIRAKQKLIKLLEEQRQTIIHRAVTRGLDPTVRLKPSGIEWLGDVPEHWVVAGLHARYEQCLGKMVDAKKVTNTRLLPYLRNVDVQWDRVNINDLPSIDISEHEQERYTVRDGDLLVCEGRHLGRSAIWRGELPICAYQKALHRLRARDSRADLPRYLYYCLYTVNFQDAFGVSSRDRSIPHLTGAMIRRYRFPFPPLPEQVSIATHLDGWSTRIDRARAAVAREIQGIREYRTRLIADVVTGKLDVREAAARLPEEPDEPDSCDDADVVAEDEMGLAEDAADGIEEAEA